MASMVHTDRESRQNRWIPKTSLWFLMVGWIAILASACTPAVPTTVAQTEPRGLLSIVLQRGTLVIATDPNYPPQSQFHPEAGRAEQTRCRPDQYTARELSGFDIAVAMEVARRMRVEPCFVTPAWSQLIAGNWSELWDIHVGSMVITTDRMENLYFTQPYTTGSAVLFIHVDNQTYHLPSDLNGKRIGVCTGCAYEDYLRGILTIPGSDIQFHINRAIPVGYETDTSALSALAKGDGVVLDAVLTDPDTGKAAIEGGLPIKQLEEVLYYDYVSVSLDKKSSRDSVPLVRRINEIIQDMHLDGTLRDLSEEYYHGDFTAPAAEYDIQALEQY